MILSSKLFIEKTCFFEMRTKREQDLIPWFDISLGPYITRFPLEIDWTIDVIEMKTIDKNTLVKWKLPLITFMNLFMSWVLKNSSSCVHIHNTNNIYNDESSFIYPRKLFMSD